MRAALNAGATVADLAKVIELTAVMGYHGVAVTTPIVLDVARARCPGGARSARTTENIGRSMVAEWANAAGQMAEFARVSPELPPDVRWTRVSGTAMS